MLEFRFFFSTFQEITVGGFVNQLIKKFWPYHNDCIILPYKKANNPLPYRDAF